ncbi:MAG: trypsin-like serine protease [Bdellovibrio sp.]|nr:trypsin-like serine protease [Bdellovibrio sp.]
MSADLRLASVLIVFLIFSSCSKDDSKNAMGRVPPLQKPGPAQPPRSPNPNAHCIPESDLVKTTVEKSNGIVGGERIYPGNADAKRVVLLFDTKGAICTATPIARDVLLTAAHCAQGLVKNYLAIFHTALSCESGFDARDVAMVSSVNEMVVHEAYIDNAPANELVGDLALIFLKKDIPVEYPIYKLAKPAQMTLENSIYFFGYGAIGYQMGSSGMLRKTELPSSKYTIDQTQKKVLLDQTSGHGVCSGDSGGPGLVSIDGELQILAVNSYVSSSPLSSDACKGNATLVLTDSYRDWIAVKLAARNRYLRQ